MQNSKASKEAEQRNACFDAATEAYKKGKKKEASELSARGKKHDEKMRSYNNQACGIPPSPFPFPCSHLVLPPSPFLYPLLLTHLFPLELHYAANNKKFKGQLHTIDLHGLHVKEALRKAEEHLIIAKAAKLQQVHIITGINLPPSPLLKKIER